MPRVKAKDGRKEDSWTRENLSSEARAETEEEAEAVVMAARTFGASLRVRSLTRVRSVTDRPKKIEKTKETKYEISRQRKGEKAH